MNNKDYNDPELTCLLGEARKTLQAFEATQNVQNIVDIIVRTAYLLGSNAALQDELQWLRSREDDDDDDDNDGDDDDDNDGDDDDEPGGPVVEAENILKGVS